MKCKDELLLAAIAGGILLYLYMKKDFIGKITDSPSLNNYLELKGKITNSNESYFVVRDTDHPIEDLDRNWSSTVGGRSLEGCEAFDTLEDANSADCDFHQSQSPQYEYRFHPAHEGFCVVHYEGLGAFELESENLEEAIEEATGYSDDLACTMGKGDGHFLAEQVISFHKVREGRYIFELPY